MKIRTLALCAATALVVRSASAQCAPTADFCVVPVCCAGWIINGQTNPTLHLIRGHTYIFEVHSAPLHPFVFKTVQGAGTGNVYTSGVMGSEPCTATCTVTFTVPTNAPNTLFYQCENHALMTGPMQITNPCAPDVNGDGTVNVADFLAFLQIYAAGDARADFNHDGQVNVADFLAFLAAYAAGC
jgi:hypothetical protein